MAHAFGHGDHNPINKRTLVVLFYLRDGTLFDLLAFLMMPTTPAFDDNGDSHFFL
jgi:hypothetical protein